MGRGGADEALRSGQIVIANCELDQDKSVLPVVWERLKTGEKWLLVDHDCDDDG